MRVCLLIYSVIIASVCFGQQVGADSVYFSDAEKYARDLYRKFIHPSARLYNGPEYVDYAYQIKKGSPFLDAEEFTPGNIVYDGMLYENVPMRFDLVKEQIVIQDPFKSYSLSLITERVSSFSCLKHVFTRLVFNDSNAAAISTGLYEVLYDENTAVYKKQRKKIQEETQQDGVMMYIVESNSYFIRKDNRLFAADSKKAMLSVFNSRKNAIQQYMGKNKLNFRKDKAGTLVKVAAYYDLLTK